MRLVPREVDKLLLHQVGRLAQQRLARGTPLNLPESTALIATVVAELVRDGKHSVAELMQLGRTLLGVRNVLSQVVSLLKEVQVEATFLDGTKLITIHEPICREDGDLTLALYGSFLPVPTPDKFPPVKYLEPKNVAGAMIIKPGTITLSPGRHRVAITVTNDGDRPIQVGSHYHFLETNPFLRFDRILAYGKHLDIPSGTAVRFEPGESKIVHLVDIAGHKIVKGGNNLTHGLVDTQKVPAILDKLTELGFRHEPQMDAMIPPEPCTISRERYASLYGPTTGDRVRLGDSSLYIEIEKDYTSYGDECVFGGGKVIRDGMGQKSGASELEALDLVITNAIIVDHTGIYKADIGIKNGLIHAIGKAGNPDIMANVSPGMTVGASTEVLAGEGNIFVAGGIDTHIHFICPQLCYEALSSGLTTLIGGGTGPNTGTNATTCTPGTTHIKMMLKATDEIPINCGFTGKGNCSSLDPLREQIEAGAVGLKLHEDWGSTPAAIDACLTVCDKYDVQATIHTDTLNESGFVETTISAIDNRVIHAYHSEGAGGGHAPDILRVVGEPNVIPSSTNPTRPYTVNTLDEHLDMLMVCHHLDKSVPEDIAFAESRIRGETIGGEDVLHDIGAISIISSDSQAMGRVGEVITRTWQTADKMKNLRGYLSQNGETEQDGPADNFRVKRYVSKYTINPAIAHGISHLVGSIEVGKMADIVVYKPEYFGTKPELIIKGGQIVWAMMGDANASIPTPEPVIGRPMFGALRPAIGSNSMSFVSKASLMNGKAVSYKLKKKMEAVKNCRKISKKDMKWNYTLPQITIDPETYQVTVDGQVIRMESAKSVCMAQTMYLF